METLFEASLLSITLSVGMGMLIAFFVAMKWQFPKNGKFFILTILLNIISPFIGQSSYLLGFSDGKGIERPGFLWTTIVENGSLEGIIAAYLLFSFFLTINIIFALKFFEVLPQKLQVTK